MTLWQKIKNEPVMLTALLVAIINILIDDKGVATSWTDLIKAFVPLALGLAARSQVTGPVNSKRLAAAIVDPPASDAAKEVAEEVLD